MLAQVCYYFEALAQLPKADRAKAVISVPSGNFGNLTAGLIAKALGLPVKRFIAATNANDTVPRYLKTGQWDPHQTVATLSNAMDVSRPNNWPRVEELCRRNGWALETLGSGMRSDAQTRDALKRLHELDYLCEPHGAIAWDLLGEQLSEDEVGCSSAPLIRPSSRSRWTRSWGWTYRCPARLPSTPCCRSCPTTCRRSLPR